MQITSREQCIQCLYQGQGRATDAVTDAAADVVAWAADSVAFAAGAASAGS